MKNVNFDLMIENWTSWKSWISISWNSTSWPWVVTLHVWTQQLYCTEFDGSGDWNRRLKVFLIKSFIIFSIFFRRSKVEKSLFSTFNLLKNFFDLVNFRRSNLKMRLLTSWLFFRPPEKCDFRSPEIWSLDYSSRIY